MVHSLYEQLMKRLCIDQRVINCAIGRVQLPLATWKSPAEWYLFPPALIPIAADGGSPAYLGLWKHWFTKCEPGFVLLYVEVMQAYEIARTDEQFFDYILVNAITEQDGVTKEIEDFAEFITVDHLTELDELTNESGDDPAGLLKLSSFTCNPPLIACKADPMMYDGHFGQKYITPDSEFDCDFASFEKNRSSGRSAFLKEVFASHLKKEDLAGAWRILNSPGWQINDARAAISELSLKAQDPDFDLLRQAWMSASEENLFINY